MSKLLNNLLGMYKQAKLNKQAEDELIEIGWGFGNNDEEMIKDTAEELEEKTDRNFWEKINKDTSNVESDFLKDGYKKFFTKVRDEGHDSNNDLGGTAWVTKQQLEDFINKAQRIDNGSYGLYESAGELDIDTYHDDALVFHLEIYVDEETLDSLNIESKRINKNKKKAIKNAKVTKKAGYSNNPDYFGDWFGKGQIDFSKIINPNDSGDVWMVKLWGGKGYILDEYLVKADDYYDAVDKVFEWSYENEGANNIVFDRENLEEEALEYFKDEPNMFGKELEEEDFIDRFLEEYYVANEDYSLFAREENFFADKVPEEYLKGNKQSSKAKAVAKQAENKEIVVTYEGTNGKEYIVKAPNGLYFNEYVDTDTQHSRGAGPFETLEKAKEMFKKHRPSAKEIVATKKQATIKHENGVYNVYSESGKCLGKGYKTKEEAEKRLKQVEYFKHKKSLRDIVISKMAGK